MRLFLSLLAIISLLTACHTMEGVGKDIQKGGKNIEKSAERNK